jgi:hypothetical protein
MLQVSIFALSSSECDADLVQANMDGAGALQVIAHLRITVRAAVTQL